MKEEQLKSLKKVVEYMHESEGKHFEECNKDEQQEHIYQDILVLQKYLEVRTPTEEMIDDNTIGIGELDK